MSLDYKLDRAVKLREDIEHKGLYSWCLREYDKNGNEVGCDQIPFSWGVIFSVVNLTYRLGFERERTFSPLRDEAPQRPQKKPFAKKESLYGRLSPEAWGASSLRKTRYSFFGTERVVGDFTIRIVEGEQEEIDVWGSPAYDFETNFVNNSHSDSLQINLVLKPDHFRHITELVNSRSIDKASLQLGGVDGFYSEWSPGIDACNIKVLPAGEDDGRVEFPDEKEWKIPRLGKVGEFNLNFDVKENISHEATSTSENSLEEIEDVKAHEEAPSKSDGIANQIKKQTDRLDKINRSLIVFAVLAFFIALKLIG